MYAIARALQTTNVVSTSVNLSYDVLTFVQFIGVAVFDPFRRQPLVAILLVAILLAGLLFRRNKNRWLTY